MYNQPQHYDLMKTRTSVEKEHLRESWSDCTNRCFRVWLGSLWIGPATHRYIRLVCGGVRKLSEHLSHVL